MRVYAFLSIVSLSLLLFAFYSVVPVHAALSWNVQIVDEEAAGIFNGYCPIAVDSNNTPHIAYQGIPRISDNRIWKMYASWNGSGWSIQEVFKGAPTDLKLDANDNPHILIESGGNLIYASWTGTEWTRQTITAGNIVYASLALDSSGYPHVAYVSGQLVKYASWMGSRWNIQTVDTSPETNIKLSLALDSNNTPYIMYVNPSSYVDNSTGINTRSAIVKLAVWKNSSWSVEPTLASYNLGGFGSMVLDSKGYPHFIGAQYHFVSSENMTLLSTILYASWNGSAWNTQTVVSGVVLGSMDLALDSHDYPHISYITPSLSGLMYARWTGTDWDIQPVITNITASGPCYLAVDSNDNPHISYRGGGPDHQSGPGWLATIAYATAFEPARDSSTFSALPLLSVSTAVIIGAVVTVVYVWKKKTQKSPNCSQENLTTS